MIRTILWYLFGASLLASLLGFTFWCESNVRFTDRPMELNVAQASLGLALTLLLAGLAAECYVTFWQERKLHKLIEIKRS